MIIRIIIIIITIIEKKQAAMDLLRVTSWTSMHVKSLSCEMVTMQAD